jgi:opacity protein-like surface antigen
MALCGMIVALISTATTARAGLFNVSDEPADWNGMYMGFNAGVVFDHYDISHYNGVANLGEQLNSLAQPAEAEDETALPFYALFLFPGSSDTDVAPIGGIHFGYRKQIGHIVGGFEFGFEGTQTSKGAKSVTFSGPNTLNDVDDVAADAFSRWDSLRYAERNWDGWVGGQIGFAWSRFLFYGTGGYTFADVALHGYDRVRTEFFGDGVLTSDFDLTRSTALASVQSDIMNGWYAGGGAQFALNDKVTLGLEYRHSDFGDQVFRFNPAHPIFPGATRVDLSSDQVEFVVNVMLGHLGATMH